MKRVVAYCRVSTDQDDQINSLESQKRYFTEYINKSVEWELIEIYADEGKSGTSTKKRKAFNKMIDDAEMGLFDLVLTKEISRFARNTLDSIFYTRKLKDLGIGVIFLNDNINTLDADSELRLTIMSSVAQEESRKTSDRVKWGQKRQMERGIVFGHEIYGYDIVNGKLVINEKEAEIVKSIFHKYLNEKKGLNNIARDLEMDGVLTKTGNKKWYAVNIQRLLQNEKYIGDLKQRKTYTINYLTHARKQNKGEEEYIFVSDTHEPIIDKDTFEKVQEEIKRRSSNTEKSRYSNRYVFSGKLFCGICSVGFISRNKVYNGKTIKRWRCKTSYKYGTEKRIESGEVVGCNSLMIREEILRYVFVKAVNAVTEDKEKVISEINEVLEKAFKLDDNNKQEETRLKAEIKRLQENNNKAVSLFLEGIITKDVLKSTVQANEEKEQSLYAKLETISKNNQLADNFGIISKQIQGNVQGIVYQNDFSEEVCRELLDKIIIHSKTKFDVYIKGYPDNNFFCYEGCNLSPHCRLTR